MLAQRSGLIDHIRRDVALGRLAVCVGQQLLRQEIDDLVEALPCANWQLQGNRFTAKTVFHLIKGPLDINITAVEFVEENQTRQALICREAPDPFSPDIDAGDSIDDDDGSICHSQGRLCLRQEVGIPRRIHHVEVVTTDLASQ